MGWAAIGIFLTIFTVIHWVRIVRYMVRHPEESGFDTIWCTAGFLNGVVGSFFLVFLFGPCLIPFGLLAYLGQPPWRRRLFYPVSISYIALVIVIAMLIGSWTQ
jgi:hypothetical protein